VLCDAGGGTVVSEARLQEMTTCLTPIFQGRNIVQSQGATTDF